MVDIRAKRSGSDLFFLMLMFGAWNSQAQSLAPIAPDSLNVRDSMDARAQETAPSSAPLATDEAASPPASSLEAEPQEPPPPLWMELYGEGTHSRHEDDNTEGFSEIKLGKRFQFILPIDVYVKTRFNRDQRQFYWNNRSDFGAGFRIPLLKKVSLTLFGEAIRGDYLRTDAGTLSLDRLQGRIDNNRAAIDQAQKDFQAAYKQVFLMDPDFTGGDTALYRQLWKSLDSSSTKTLTSLSALDAKLDSLETSKDSLRQAMDSLALVPARDLWEYRGGLIFWYGWGQEPAESERGKNARVHFPFRFWGEIYSDCIFSALRRTVSTRGGGEAYQDSLARLDNLIYYGNPAVGAIVVDGVLGSVAAYATLYAWFDTHKDWWNNLAMIGPGLRYKPFAALDFVVSTEYVWGRYYGRENAEDPNPYSRNFRDLRVNASFWYGLGI